MIAVLVAIVAPAVRGQQQDANPQVVQNPYFRPARQAVGPRVQPATADDDRQDSVHQDNPPAAYSNTGVTPPPAARGSAGPEPNKLSNPFVSPLDMDPAPTVAANPFAADAPPPTPYPRLRWGPVSRWRTPRESVDDSAASEIQFGGLQRLPRAPLLLPTPHSEDPLNYSFTDRLRAKMIDSSVASDPQLPLATPPVVQPDWVLPAGGEIELAAAEEAEYATDSELAYDPPSSAAESSDPAWYPPTPQSIDPFEEPAAEAIVISDQTPDSQETPGPVADAEPLADVPDELAYPESLAISADDENDPPAMETAEAEVPAPQSPEALLAAAREQAVQVNDVEALSTVIALCRKALAGTRDFDQSLAARQLAAWAHNRRGELLAESGGAQAALNDFQAAVSLDPNCWLALHNRAISHAQSLNYERALRDFRRVVELNPGLTVAYCNRAELFVTLGRTDDAIRDYSQAIRQLPDRADLLVRRGEAYQRSDQPELAKADFNAALQIDTDNAAAYHARGNLLAEEHQYHQALADLRQAIRIQPRRVDALRSLAWLLATCPDESLRSAAEALAAAHQAAALSRPDDPWVLEALAAAHANARQFDEAIRYERQALAVAPNDVREDLEVRLGLYSRGLPFRTSRPSPVRQASYTTGDPPPQLPR